MFQRFQHNASFINCQCSIARNLWKVLFLNVTMTKLFLVSWASNQWSYGIKILAIRIPRVEICGFPRNPRSADLAGWIRIRVPRNAPLNPRGGGAIWPMQFNMCLHYWKHDDIVVAVCFDYFLSTLALCQREDLLRSSRNSFPFDEIPKENFPFIGRRRRKDWFSLAFLKRLSPLKWLFFIRMSSCIDMKKNYFDWFWIKYAG